MARGSELAKLPPTVTFPVPVAKRAKKSARKNGQDFPLPLTHREGPYTHQPAPHAKVCITTTARPSHPCVSVVSVSLDFRRNYLTKWRKEKYTHTHTPETAVAAVDDTVSKTVFFVPCVFLPIHINTHTHTCTCDMQSQSLFLGARSSTIIIALTQTSNRRSMMVFVLHSKDKHTQ